MSHEERIKRLANQIRSLNEDGEAVNNISSGAVELLDKKLGLYRRMLNDFSTLKEPKHANTKHQTCKIDTKPHLADVPRTWSAAWKIDPVAG